MAIKARQMEKPAFLKLKERGVSTDKLAGGMPVRAIAFGLVDGRKEDVGGGKVHCPHAVLILVLKNVLKLGLYLGIPDVL